MLSFRYRHTGLIAGLAFIVTFLTSLLWLLLAASGSSSSPGGEPQAKLLGQVQLPTAAGSLNILIEDVSPGHGSTPEGTSSLWGKMFSVVGSGNQLASGPPTSWTSWNGPDLVEHLAASDQDGNLILFYYYPGGDWKAVNVSEIAGSKIAIERPEAWINASISTEYLAAPSPSGDLLLFTWNVNTDWVASNISSSFSKKVIGPATGWITPNGVEHLAIRSLNNELLVFFRWPGSGWALVNVTQMTGRQIAGPPTSWQVAGAELIERVAAQDAGGNLLLFSFMPSTDWQVQDLTQQTHQTIDGPPGDWMNSGSGQENIAARAPNGDLLVFRSGAIDGGFYVQNLTALTGNVYQVSGTPTCWSVPLGSTPVEHVGISGTNGHLLVFNRSVGSTWDVKDVTNVTNHLVTQPPTNWITANGPVNVEHMAAPDAGGHLIVFYFDPGQDWAAVDTAVKASGRTLYAAAPMAGIWRSRDYGMNWTQSTRPQPAQGVATTGGFDVHMALDVAVSPTDPLLVLGTTSRDIRSTSRSGIYRSTDGGQSWALVHQFTCNNKVEPVTQILFAPGSSTTVYAAGGCAIAVSQNAGLNWTNQTLPGISSGSRVWNVALGALQPGEKRPAFACGNGSFWYSITGGQNWYLDKKASTALPQNFCAEPGPTSDNSSHVLAIEPGSLNRVYLAYPAQANGPSYFHDKGSPPPADGTLCNDPSASIFRGCGEGSLWYGDLSSFNPANPTALQGTWAQLPGPSVFWSNLMTDSGAVYVYTHSTSQGFLVFFADQDSVHVSVGKPTQSQSWHRMDGWNPSENKRQNKLGNVMHVHCDPHALYVSPDFDLTLKPVRDMSNPYNLNSELHQCLGGRLWMSNDGGIYRSDDCGKSWIPTQDGLSTLAAINISASAMSGSAKPGLYFGTGDNDDFSSVDGGAVWKDADGGCGDCDAWFTDPAQPERVLRLSPRFGTAGRFDIFSDSGSPPDATKSSLLQYYDYLTGMYAFCQSWKTMLGYRPLIYTPSGDSPLSSGDYIAIQEIAKTATQAARRILMRAQDSIGGSTPWTQVGPDLPANAVVAQAAGVHSAPTFFVGDESNLWRWRSSQSNINQWETIVPGGVATQAKRFFVNPYNANEIYIIDQNAVRHTTDGGTSWPVDSALDYALSAGGEFPRTCSACGDGNFILNDMVFDRQSNQTRFAIGLAGVFYSGDGTNWFRLLDTRAMPGRPRGAYFDRVSDPSNRSLYVAFQGRGILRFYPIPGTIPPPPPPPPPLLLPPIPPEPPENGLRLVGNPSFESGNPGPWATYGRTAVVTTRPRTGEYSLRMGTENDSQDGACLDLSIPSKAVWAFISFWCYIDSQDAQPGADNMHILVTQGAQGSTLGSLSNTDPQSRWLHRWYDLTAFRGQEIRICFRVEENSKLPTVFYVDDVNIGVITGDLMLPIILKAMLDLSLTDGLASLAGQSRSPLR